MQYLEKCSSTIQQLAYKGWHQVNRLEELLTRGGRGGRRWSNWRIISNRRQRASFNFTHAWHWWHRLWFLAGFKSTHPLEEPWCWRTILRIPWTTGRSNQSILKEINFEYSLERLRLKLKLQYFGHLMWRPTNWKRLWWWERLKAKGEEGGRRWDG